MKHVEMKAQVQVNVYMQKSIIGRICLKTAPISPLAIKMWSFKTSGLSGWLKFTSTLSTDPSVSMLYSLTCLSSFCCLMVPGEGG